jgi:hypothetical protein
MEAKRIVCWFSGRVASAVATKLAIAANADGPALPLVVVRVSRGADGADQKRFVDACERWFGVPVELIAQRKQPLTERLLSRVARRSTAALYSRRMREARHAFERSGDIQVFGYTADEAARVARLRSTHPTSKINTVLIDRGYFQSDCLETLFWNDIRLPVTYRFALSEGLKGPVGLDGQPVRPQVRVQAKIA